MEQPTGNCSAGYYCTSGVDMAQPDGSTNIGTGGKCGQGFYCPAGSSTMIACPAGTYALSEGEF